LEREEILAHRHEREVGQPKCEENRGRATP
jgi:hypothetical protein